MKAALVVFGLQRQLCGGLSLLRSAQALPSCTTPSLDRESRRRCERGEVPSGRNLRLRGGGRKLTVVSAHGRADGGEEVPLAPGRIAQRAAFLTIMFLLPVMTSPLALLVAPFRTLVWFRLLAFSLGRSGAAFIKWSQWASVRPDMFPQALCDVLSTLTSAAPTHSWEFTRRQLQTAVGGDSCMHACLLACLHVQPRPYVLTRIMHGQVGGDLDSYFDEIETSAFASGSIAQVQGAM